MLTIEIQLDARRPYERDYFLLRYMLRISALGSVKFHAYGNLLDMSENVTGMTNQSFEISWPKSKSVKGQGLSIYCTSN